MSAQMKIEKKTAFEKTVITRVELEAEFKERFKNKNLNEDERLYNLCQLAVKRGVLEVVREIYDTILPKLARDPRWINFTDRNYENPMALAVAYNQTKILDFLFDTCNYGKQRMVSSNTWKFPERIGSMTNLFELAVKLGYLQMCLHLFDLGKKEIAKTRNDGALLYICLNDIIAGSLKRAALTRPKFFMPIFNHVKDFFPSSDQENFKSFISCIVNVMVMLDTFIEETQIIAFILQLDESDRTAVMQGLSSQASDPKSRAAKLVTLLQSHLDKQNAKKPAVSKPTEADAAASTDGQDKNAANKAMPADLAVLAGAGATEDTQVGRPILSQFDQLNLAQVAPAALIVPVPVEQVAQEQCK